MEEPVNEEPKLEFEISRHTFQIIWKTGLNISIIYNRIYRQSSTVYCLCYRYIFGDSFVLDIANITAAMAIGESIGRMTYGFAIVALFNLALALFILIARKAIISRPVGNWIIKVLTKSLEADEINSLDTLSSEKIRLQNEAESMTASLTNDVEMIKKAIQPWLWSIVP